MRRPQPRYSLVSAVTRTMTSKRSPLVRSMHSPDVRSILIGTAFARLLDHITSGAVCRKLRPCLAVVEHDARSSVDLERPGRILPGRAELDASEPGLLPGHRGGLIDATGVRFTRGFGRRLTVAFAKGELAVREVNAGGRGDLGKGQRVIAEEEPDALGLEACDEAIVAVTAIRTCGARQRHPLDRTGAGELHRDQDRGCENRARGRDAHAVPLVPISARP